VLMQLDAAGPRALAIGSFEMAKASTESLARKGDRLINMRETCALLHCSRATVQRRLKDDPDFPPPHPGAFKNGHLWWESKMLVYAEREKSAAA
jgi:predicted DNA-binding transcriptional regulator AlpA